MLIKLTICLLFINMAVSSCTIIYFKVVEFKEPLGPPLVIAPPVEPPECPCPPSDSLIEQPIYEEPVQTDNQVIEKHNKRPINPPRPIRPIRSGPKESPNNSSNVKKLPVINKRQKTNR